MTYIDLARCAVVSAPNSLLESDWQESFQQGAVYYLNLDHVRGVLLWNVWDQVDQVRELIAHPGPFTPEDLKGRLPICSYHFKYLSPPKP